MIPLAIILIATWSAPGVKPITTRSVEATMHDCEVGAGIYKLITYFDPDMRVKTECKETK